MKKAFFFIILIFASVVSGCTSPFFDPQKEYVLNPKASAAGHKDVFFTAKDGVRLHGWYVAASNEKKGTVLFLHGYSRNISIEISKVLWLASEGYDVFAFDYRGYGKSDGIPTIAGVHLDTQAALDTIFKIEGARTDRVFVLGQSLGGAIAIYSVANSPHKDRIKALIIDCAFSSYRDIAREQIRRLIVTWPLGYLSEFIEDDFSPVRWIGQISPVPVVIIHGDMDEAIPIRHGLSLYRAALEPKEFWIAEGKGHVRAFTDADIKSRLVAFLGEIK